MLFRVTLRLFSVGNVSLTVEWTGQHLRISSHIRSRRARPEQELCRTERTKSVSKTSYLCLSGLKSSQRSSGSGRSSVSESVHDRTDENRTSVVSHLIWANTQTHTHTHNVGDFMSHEQKHCVFVFPFNSKLRLSDTIKCLPCSFIHRLKSAEVCQSNGL